MGDGRRFRALADFDECNAFSRPHFAAGAQKAEMRKTPPRPNEDDAKE